MMITYFLFYIIVCGIASFNKCIYLKLGHITIRIPTLRVVFFVIAFFLAFRDAIGVDDAGYINTFNQISEYGKPWRNIEPSYTYICKLIQFFGGGSQWVFVVYSTISCILYCTAIERLCPKYEQVFFVYAFVGLFFIDSITIMRQFLACGFLLHAYANLKCGNKKWVIIHFALAIFSHTTAIVAPLYYLGAYIIPKWSKTKKIVILCVLYAFQFVHIKQLVFSAINILGLPQDNYYVKYFLNEGSSFIFTNRLGVIYTFLMLITIIIIIFNKEKKTGLIMEYETYAVEYWMVTLATTQFGYIGRLAYYLGFFLCGYISKTIMMFNKKSKKYVTCLLFIGFLIIFMYFVLSYRIKGSDINPLIPYRFNFSDL